MKYVITFFLHFIFISIACSQEVSTTEYKKKQDTIYTLQDASKQVKGEVDLISFDINKNEFKDQILNIPEFNKIINHNQPYIIFELLDFDDEVLISNLINKINRSLTLIDKNF